MKRSRFWRIYTIAMLLATGLLVWAGVAYFSAINAEAQSRVTPGGGGIIPPGSSDDDDSGETVRGDAEPKFIEILYLSGGGILPQANGSVGAGFKLTESFNMLQTTPIVYGVGQEVEMEQGSEQRFRYQEFGMNYGALNLLHSEAQNYRFAITNIDAIDPGMGDKGMIYVCIGDTAFTTVDDTPDGFGVIVCGEDYVFGGIVAQEWVAFVGNGTDTTYAALGTNVGDDNRFEIYAAAEGGAVEFYLNGSLAATIESPARSNNEDTKGISIWFQNDTTNFWSKLQLGPFWTQREWD